MTEARRGCVAAHRPARWQPTTITAIERLTPRVMGFRFRPSQPFAYAAGQHVDVRLTAPDGYTAQRSYSIASAPEAGDEIELAIERLDDGEVSPFFHEVAAVGDEIEMKGPLGGHFVWDAAEPRADRADRRRLGRGAAGQHDPPPRGKQVEDACEPDLFLARMGRSDLP